ncbi:MAG: endonuclease [Armatimonadetes bacterium]|nr:endonuclease [Armatimonadota bacterium]
MREDRAVREANVRQNRYRQIIERIFFDYHTEGAEEVPFRREDIIRVAGELGIDLPKNLGDVVYSFRYRAALPESIQTQAPPDRVWIIRSTGRSVYTFVAVANPMMDPRDNMAETKIPDSTPGVVAMYSFNDEQALLARLRYNRLIDIFIGVTCYSLQNHLRTFVPGIGQVETDELYIGVDRQGVHYVFPVQAKGGTDRLSIVQIEQDFALCAHRYPNLICRGIGAQFMEKDLIALFEFEEGENGIVLATERHYRLVPPESLSAEDLVSYRRRLQGQ